MSGTGCHGNRTLSGFIGHESPFNTLDKGNAESTAEHGLRCKSAAEYGIEKVTYTA